MKKLYFLMAILAVSLFAYSQIKILSRSERYPSKKREGTALNRLSRQNKRIEELLRRRSNRPNYFDQTEKFNLSIGTTIQARLLNSIVSDNLASPILAEALDDPLLPSGTRFSCSGGQVGTRVHVACNLVILEGQEYPLEAKILNLDGSAGLRGDVFSGSDQKVAR